MPNESPEHRHVFSSVRLVVRYVKLAMVAAMVLCIAAVVVFLLRWKPLDWNRIERSTMEFLHREDLMFLVTDRVATRVDMVSKEGSVLLGWHDSVLVGTVRFLAGINLQKLTPEDIRAENGRLVVTVPDPEVLDLAVDLNSLVLFEKKSGLVAIKDYLQNRDTRGELQGRLEQRAREFAAEQDLLPKRDALVKRLNDWVSPLLKDKMQCKVEFR